MMEKKRVSEWKSMRKGAGLTYFEVIYGIFLWDWAEPRITALLTCSVFKYKETGYLIDVDSGLSRTVV